MSKRVNLSITGMHCASCATLIGRQLKKTPGVVESNVNFATEKASVVFDESQANTQALIAAVEKAAQSRKCRFVRLEVHEKNHGAIVCYRKAGYEQFDRHHEYYEDKGHALRFQKRIDPR